MVKALKVPNAHGRQRPTGYVLVTESNFMASSFFVVLTRRGREKRQGRSLAGGKPARMTKKKKPSKRKGWRRNLNLRFLGNKVLYI
jgi:hypothetical protein